MGFSYPLKLNKNGGLSISVGNDRIFEQIIEILDTAIGERIYRPSFGCPNIIFQSIQSVDLILIQIEQLLRSSLPSNYVSDIAVFRRNSNIIEGVIELEVTYVYIPTNKKQSLLYANT